MHFCILVSGLETYLAGHIQLFPYFKYHSWCIYECSKVPTPALCNKKAQQRERPLFRVWDVLYLPKRKKPHNFSAHFPAFLESQMIIKIKFNVEFSKTFFPIRKWNENSRQDHEDLWILVTP